MLGLTAADILRVMRISPEHTAQSLLSIQFRTLWAYNRAGSEALARGWLQPEPERIWENRGVLTGTWKPLKRHDLMRMVASMLTRLGYVIVGCGLSDEDDNLMTIDDLRVYFYQDDGAIHITYVKEKHLHELDAFLAGSPRHGPVGWQHPIALAKAPKWVEEWLAPFRPEGVAHQNQQSHSNGRGRSTSVPRCRPGDGDRGFASSRSHSVPRRKTSGAWATQSLSNDPRWSRRPAASPEPSHFASGKEGQAGEQGPAQHAPTTQYEDAPGQGADRTRCVQVWRESPSKSPSCLHAMTWFIILGIGTRHPRHVPAANGRGGRPGLPRNPVQEGMMGWG